jgi:hypothetical protein
MMTLRKFILATAIPIFVLPGAVLWAFQPPARPVTGVASVSFLVQPGNTPVGEEIAPAVTVLVRDIHQNPVAGVEVGMSIGPLPPNPAALSGEIRQSTSRDGVARFQDLQLDYFGNGYRLVATVATLAGPLRSVSNPFNETRVGDPCLGPNPACSSACADSDGDGLNDAWERAGGIDLNGDGKIDARHDLLLPGAEVHRPDIYVQYDWMDYGYPGNACNADADCSAPGSLATGRHRCGGGQVRRARL